MLENLYLEIVDISFNSVVLIVTVLLGRQVLKRMPKVLSYCLWSFVAFRLLMPFTLQLPFGLSPVSVSVFPQYSPSDIYDPRFDSLKLAVNAVKNALSGKFNVQTIQVLLKSDVVEGASTCAFREVYFWWESLIYFGQYLWIAGAAVLLFLGVFRYLKLRFRCARGETYQGNVFISDKISAPVILGILDAKIFIPASFDENARNCSIFHAKMHEKRYDLYWKMLGYLTLCLHWFNPLVWIAYKYLCRDLEVSCDEAVLRNLHGEQREGYLCFLKQLPSGFAIKEVCLQMPIAEADGERRILCANQPAKKLKRVVYAAALIFCAIIGCFTFDHSYGRYGSDAMLVFPSDPFFTSKQSVNFKMDEFPGVEFTYGYSQRKLIATDKNSEKIIFNSSIDSLYLADLNRDGKRELCASSFRAGESIRVYDYANDVLYALDSEQIKGDAPLGYDFTLRNAKGELFVRVFSFDYTMNVYLVHSLGKLAIRNGQLLYRAGFTSKPGIRLTPLINERRLSDLLRDHPESGDWKNAYWDDGCVVTGYSKFISNYLSNNREAIARGVSIDGNKVRISEAIGKNYPEEIRYLRMLGELAWEDYKRYVLYDSERPDELFVCTQFREKDCNDIETYYQKLVSGEIDAHPDTYIIRLHEFVIYRWGSEENLYPALASG